MERDYTPTFKCAGCGVITSVIRCAHTDEDGNLYCDRCVEIDSEED